VAEPYLGGVTRTNLGETNRKNGKGEGTKVKIGGSLYLDRLLGTVDPLDYIWNTTLHTRISQHQKIDPGRNPPRTRRRPYGL